MKKHILITGSTDGIGKLAALRFAKEGHHVYVHGRNATKLDTLVNDIKTASGNSRIKGYVADFSDLSAVRRMAAHVQKEIVQLDVLINNAGIFKSPVSKTKDGFDIRFVVNYLAPYILTHQLISLMAMTSGPRIINLGSAAQAPVSIDALYGKMDLTDQSAYAQSKLALTMWSFQLAKDEKSVSTIVVNPGSLLNTKMAHEAYGSYWSPADKGSNILYDLALSSEYDGITGKYFNNDLGDKKGHFDEAHQEAYNQESIQALAEATDDIIGPN